MKIVMLCLSLGGALCGASLHHFDSRHGLALDAVNGVQTQTEAGNLAVACGYSISMHRGEVQAYWGRNLLEGDDVCGCYKK